MTSRSLKEMLAAIHDLDHVYSALREDVGRCVEILKEADDQFARRQLVRAVFAWIEGVIFRLKQLSYQALTVKSPNPPPEDVSCLLEEIYDIDESGTAQKRPPNLRLMPNIRFAFKTLIATFEADFSLDVSGSGWERLQRCVIA
jgi:hypothetical protein